MPVLTIGTRSYEVSEQRILREAQRMFRMSPARRGYRVEAAKDHLVRAAEARGDAADAARQAAAVLLSQGIREI
jgi:hypothetical protein